MSDQDQVTDDPFLERPDEHQVGDELYCWMPGNYDRECNGSCVSFDELALEDDTMTTCKVLNIMRVMGAAAQVGAKHLQYTQKRAQTSAVASKVREIPDPPEVR